MHARGLIMIAMLLIGFIFDSEQIMGSQIQMASASELDLMVPVYGTTNGTNIYLNSHQTSLTVNNTDLYRFKNQSENYVCIIDDNGNVNITGGFFEHANP